MKITKDQAKEALNTISSTSSNAKEVAQNADLLNLFVGVINASLAGLEGKTAAALGLIDKQATVAGFVGKQRDMTGLKLASGTIQITTQTLSLLKLGANASPGAVVAAVGAMFTKKVSLALGMVENNKQAKILEVTTDCAASLFGLGGAVLGVGTPVGWILLAAALAQTGASAYQAYAVSQEE